MLRGGVGTKFAYVGCLWSLASVLAVGGCSSSAPRRPAAPPPNCAAAALGPAKAKPSAVTETAGTVPTQEGRASWYGPSFHGKRTSNGEIYNQYALTAAHKTLPAGTCLTVTNLDNQQTVEVRVNDRGPFVEERILDLSFAAAKALDMIGSGTAPVRIEVLGATGDSLPSVGYAVQVGSFSEVDNANQLRRKLAANLDRVYVIEADRGGEPIFRVRIGPYDIREQADRRASEVRAMGWSAIIMEEAIALR